MKNNFLIVSLLLISLLPIFSLEEKPLWVEFEEAKSAYQNGAFQEALDFFIEATKGETPFPEAEYMIGLLYLEEGELDLAETQIKKAIDQSIFLQVKEDLNIFKYKLASIYLLKEDYDSYVYTLKDIIGRENIDLKEVRDQRAYYDTIIESGINRLLHLYRVKADNVINARILLGYYYNSLGDYLRGVNYLITPMLGIISEVIEDKIEEDREYIFISIETFFSEIDEDSRVSSYLEENDFYKLFYYLAESFYGLGEKDLAKELWQLLANSNIDSMWVTKSKTQLKSPSLEDWKLIY